MENLDELEKGNVTEEMTADEETTTIELLLGDEGSELDMEEVTTHLGATVDSQVLTDNIVTAHEVDGRESLPPELSVCEAVGVGGTASINDISTMTNMAGVDIVTLPSGQVQPLFQIMGSGSEGSSYVLSDGQMMQAATSNEIQNYQTMTLSSGVTALIQQQGTKENTMLQAAKLLEGQVIQLEDGTTGLIQAGLHGPEGVQSVQLEDGSTAYISLFGETAGSTLSIDSSVTGHEIHPTIEVAADTQPQLPADGNVTLTIKKEPEAAACAGDYVSHPIAGELSDVQDSVLSTHSHTSERALALGDRAYKCLYEGCGRLYTTQHHLKVHERSHTGDRPFRCEFPGCGKAFATGYGLKSHTRVHTGEKPYRCPDATCGKAFKTSGDLQKHVRTHTGERPFRCPFEGCERSFTTSNIRKVHIRTHTGERPYVCIQEGCNKSFASATNFKNHVRTHTGEKPYVCTVEGCGKRFTEYSSLYKHHVVHTQSKPYICSHCNKTYRQTSTLAMHKRTVHNDHDVSLKGDAAMLGAISGVQIISPLDAETAASDRDRDLSEEDGALVINTSDPTLIGGRGRTNTTPILTTLQTVPQGSPSLVHGLAMQGGMPIQQVYLITGAAQLESLKHITQHTTTEEEQIPKSVAGMVSSDGTAMQMETAATIPEHLLNHNGSVITVVAPEGATGLVNYQTE